MSDLKNKVLEKIKKGEVKRKPAFYFIGKNYFFWTMFFVSIFVGSASFAVFIRYFLIESGPWYEIFEKYGVKYPMEFLPFLWLFVLILFVLSAWLNFKHTKKAYKKHNYLVVILSILVSVFLGTIMFLNGFGRIADDALQKHIPIYRQYKEQKMQEKIEILKSLGIDPDEFIKHRKFRRCTNAKCRWERIKNEIFPKTLRSNK